MNKYPYFKDIFPDFDIKYYYLMNSKIWLRDKPQHRAPGTVGADPKRMLLARKVTLKHTAPPAEL